MRTTRRCFCGGSVSASGASACVGYGDSLVLNMSRRIAERGFEDAFLKRMESLGINADDEQMSI